MTEPSESAADQAFAIETLIDPTVFEGMGLLIGAASIADMRLGVQIVRLISPINFISYHAMPVVVGMDFQVKIQLLRVLTMMLDRKNARQLAKLCDGMQSLYKRRNYIAHCALGPGRKPNEAAFQNLKASPRSGQIPPPLYLTADDLKKDAASLLIAVGTFEQELTKLGYPTEGATPDDIAARQPVSETGKEASRPSRSPRPKRKKRPAKQKD